MGILILLIGFVTIVAVPAAIAVLVARYFRGGFEVLVFMATFMLLLALAGALLWSWLSTQRIQFY